jgi:hypothetical protein
MVLLFIALFYFSPGFATPLFYRQTDELRFSAQAIGNLGVFSSFFGILATVVYSQLIRRVQIRAMLLIGKDVGPGTLFTSSIPHGPWLCSSNHKTGSFFPRRARSSRPAARARRRGGRARYSLMPIRNVAGSGADIVGSHLADDNGHLAAS